MWAQSDIPDLPSWAPNWHVRLSTSTLERRMMNIAFEASPFKHHSVHGVEQISGKQKRIVLGVQAYSIDLISILLDVSEIPDVEFQPYYFY